MNLKDEAIIVYVKNIKDNNLFIKILSKDNGLINGIVYGGNSKKYKMVYQIGSFINFNLIKKNENALSNISGELIYPFISSIYNDKYKLYAILTSCALINNSISENQIFNKIYLGIKELFNSFNNKHWFYDYSMWILIYLSELGYGFDWNEIKSKKKYLYLNNLHFFNKQEIDFFDEKLYIKFPYNLILYKKITYQECDLLFIIFENIMLRHLLDKSKHKLPKIYFDFKEIILSSLIK